MTEEDLASVDLKSMRGVQEALAKLGLDPGTVDGFDGPNTQKAVRQFQESAGIGADGIVGPQTREALANALRGIERRADDTSGASGAEGGGSGAEGGGDAPPS